MGEPVNSRPSSEAEATSSTAASRLAHRWSLALIVGGLSIVVAAAALGVFAFTAPARAIARTQASGTLAATEIAKVIAFYSSVVEVAIVAGIAGLATAIAGVVGWRWK